MKNLFITIVIAVLPLVGVARSYETNASCQADAGLDRKICLGDKTILGGSPTASGGTAPYSYSWSPATGLDNPNTANPVANPKVTTTYILQITDASGCVSSSSVKVTVNTPPTVDAGKDKNICLGDFVQLGGAPAVTGGVPPYTYQWIPTVGLDNPTSPNPIASPSVTTFYFLFVEDSFGCQNVNMVVVNVDEPAIVNAGPDIDACENETEISLNGLVSGTTDTGIWSTSGTGTFSPDESTLNASYLRSIDDIDAGSVILTLESTGNKACSPTSDQVLITFFPETKVVAGADTTICSASPILALNGQVSGTTTSGYWTTSGSGYFSPDSVSMNASYVPGSTDITNGAVTITLNSTNSYSCGNSQNSFIITYKDLTADAGIDQLVCKNNPEILLNGTKGGLIKSYYWSTNGTGVFSPSNTSLSPKYIPSQQDLDGDSLQFTFVVAGVCDTTSAGMTVKFQDAPIVTADLDKMICEGEQIEVTGNISGNYSAFSWETTGKGTFTAPASLNGFYVPTQSDYDKGSVVITLKAANDPINCAVESASFKVTFTSPLTIDLKDMNVCFGDSTAVLDPKVTGIMETAKWTSNGTGYFYPSDTTLNASYVLSNKDKSNGTVMISLNLANSCSNISDNLSLNIQEELKIDTGSDFTYCYNKNGIVLSATSNSNTDFSWTSNGSGSFVNGNKLITSYLPSPEDLNNSSIQFVLNASDNCNSATDTIVVTLEPFVLVEAGDIIQACPGDFIQLNGQLTGVGSTTWKTSGTGSFLPNSSTLNALYIPSLEDVQLGTIELILDSDGTCGKLSDTTTLEFLKPVVVDAGPDKVFCAAESAIELTGTVSDSSIAFEWTTLGDGSLIVSSDKKTYYAPGENDIENGEVKVILSTVTTFSCQEASDTLSIVIKKSVEVDAGEDFMAENPEIKLSARISQGTGVWSTSGTGYFMPGEDPLSSTYMASQMDIVNGKVTITIISTDESCGAVSDEINIGFSSDDILPNAFTPDGDGINDTYLDGINKIIYNRYGQQIYKGSAGWDGTNSGRPVSQGTYFYKIIEKPITNDSKLTGSVTVIRK